MSDRDLDSDEQAEKPAKPKGQADLLVALTRDIGVTLFRDRKKKGYASVPIGPDTFATYALRSREFKTFLAARFYEQHKRVARAPSLGDAVAALEGMAVLDTSSIESDVALRVSGMIDSRSTSSRIAIDLGDDAWRCAVVTAKGWRVAKHGKLRFRRGQTSAALPDPVRGGNLRDLMHHIHVDGDDWLLLAAWLTSAIRPVGPYPILLLVGEQGAAKTTTARMVRKLIDPSVVEARGQPRDVRDLAIAANNSWLAFFDNTSGISGDISDGLCRLATGGGWATRSLYSDDEETVLNACCPVIITAIEDVVGRPDLLDRAVIVRLQPISEAQRRTEDEVWRAFERDRPLLLGALLDAAATAIRRLPDVMKTTPRLPRLADFAAWAMAAEPAFTLNAGSFIDAYDAGRADAHAVALESTPIDQPLRRVLEDAGGEWSGTATELLERLNQSAREEQRHHRSWPKAAKQLAGQIRRLAPSFRAAGLAVDERRTGHGGARTIRITTHAADDADAADDPNLGLSLASSFDPTKKRDKESASAASATSACVIFMSHPTTPSLPCVRCGREWVEHPRAATVRAR